MCPLLLLLPPPGSSPLEELFDVLVALAGLAGFALALALVEQVGCNVVVLGGMRCGRGARWEGNSRSWGEGGGRGAERTIEEAAGS